MKHKTIMLLSRETGSIVETQTLNKISSKKSNNKLNVVTAPPMPCERAG